MMEPQRFRCDGSAWEFDVRQDGREVVARLFFRGERYGPEFRDCTAAGVQRAIGKWIVLHADKAGGLLNVGALH